MSVVDRTADGEVQHEELPAFELECMYDDWEDPTAVTVFSTADDDSLCAAWLTVDRAHAVPLTEVR